MAAAASSSFPSVPSEVTVRALDAATQAFRRAKATRDWFDAYRLTLREARFEPWLAHAEAALNFNVVDDLPRPLCREYFLIEFATLWVNKYTPDRMAYLQRHEPDFTNILLRAMQKESHALGELYAVATALDSSSSGSSSKRKAEEEKEDENKKPRVDSSSIPAQLDTLLQRLEDVRTHLASAPVKEDVVCFVITGEDVPPYGVRSYVMRVADLPGGDWKDVELQVQNKKKSLLFGPDGPMLRPRWKEGKPWEGTLEQFNEQKPGDIIEGLFKWKAKRPLSHSRACVAEANEHLVATVIGFVEM